MNEINVLSFALFVFGWLAKVVELFFVPGTAEGLKS